MADNVAIRDAAGNNVTVATDEVVDPILGTVEVQYTKVMDGTPGSTNKQTVDSGGAARVSIASANAQDIMSEILLELRIMRLALVKLACDDYRTNPNDFRESLGLEN